MCECKDIYLREKNKEQHYNLPVIHAHGKPCFRGRINVQDLNEHVHDATGRPDTSDPEPVQSPACFGMRDCSETRSSLGMLSPFGIDRLVWDDSV